MIGKRSWIVWPQNDCSMPQRIGGKERSVLAYKYIQSSGIDVAYRVRSGIYIGVDSAFKLKRIGLDVPPHAWVVIAVPVVVKSRFLIIVLSRVAQVVLNL